MDNSPFKPRRLARAYRQSINAPPKTVFPLLCPVRESEWLDGWRYTLIYSKSGLVEEGAVFSTQNAAEVETLWIVTRYEPENLRLEFTRFTHKSRICVLGIAVSTKTASSSHVDICYTYTSIAPSGNSFIEGFTEEAFLKSVRFWEDSMNHYLETGERLKMPD